MNPEVIVISDSDSDTETAVETETPQEEKARELAFQTPDVIVHFLNKYDLKELVAVSRVNTYFLEAAQINAKRIIKCLSIVTNRDLHWMDTNLRDVLQFFGPWLKGFELKWENTRDTHFLGRKMIESLAQLETLRLIDWPGEWRGEVRRLTVAKSLTTLTFNMAYSMARVYPLLPSFTKCDIRNLNFFQRKYYVNQYPEMDFLTTWLDDHRSRGKYIHSIWLPDDFCFDLQPLGEQVHTLRISVNKICRESMVSNLHVLKNLTKLRIDAVPIDASTDHALNLLKTYGELHGHMLRELQLVCDFQRFRFSKYLRLFPNLEKLIIAYVGRSYAYPILENLQWAETLKELKIIGFSITKDEFHRLVGREHLRRLDVGESHFWDHDMHVDIRKYRNMEYEFLKILSRRVNGINYLDPNLKYLETGKIQFINLNYPGYTARVGLGIHIEFVGMKEPEYWTQVMDVSNLTSHPMLRVDYDN